MIRHHDQRSPLLGIVSLPQLLLKKPDLPARDRKILEMIHLSGNRMLNMINTSLAMHRIEAGAYQPRPTQCDLLIARTLGGGIELDVSKLGETTVTLCLPTSPPDSPDIGSSP